MKSCRVGTARQGIPIARSNILKRKAYMKKLIFPALIVLLISFSACAPTPPPQDSSKEMTLGLVQKEIRTGMSQADVAEAIGSPNIVTKDGSGKETWIYDKMATESFSSNRTYYGTILILGFSSGAARSSSTQKTLTVVLKFNDKGNVEKITYHASKF